MYEILETHCIYKEGRLNEVAVLWNDNGSVRATYSDSIPKGGYHYLNKDDVITFDLIQEVAGYGTYVDEERRVKYFPGERSWSR